MIRVVKKIEQEAFGPNIWLVDDMFRRYQENPQAVGESWREFFEDYTPQGAPRRAATQQRSEAKPAKTRPASQGDGADRPRGRAREGGPRDAAERSEARARDGEGTPSRADDDTRTRDERPKSAPEGATPLRGVSARIAENMEASLAVPTATSVRTIPAKLLEENRRIINRYLAARQAGKVSYTHVIGWAVLKALEKRPAMNAAFVEVDGRPHVVQHKHVNFGLAVDVERGGTRTLLVPNLKNADELDFAGFWACYEELIRKVRANKLTLDDFAGTSVTLTNPGTVGTSQSVPRLMQGQGLIVGTGAITYPPEYEAADDRTIARLGISKLITITSTYDHRIIQGAESGQFLAEIHGLLLGEDRFYDELFASLRVPYEPARWERDRRSGDDADAHLEKQGRVTQLINMHRVRGHLLAELNPIGWEVLSHPELDLSHYGLTVWDLDREFLTDGIPGPSRQTLRSIIDTLRDAYCQTTGFEYMHISHPDQKQWLQEKVEPGLPELTRDEKKHVLDRLNRAEAFERFVHAKYTGHKRYSLEGAESLIPMLDVLFEEAAAAGMVEAVMGMAHRGRLNVLANIVGKPLDVIFKEFEGDIDPSTVQGSGDVKYHVGMTGRFTSRRGDDMAVVVASNPSHLESNDPVVEGMARAKQDLLGEGSDRMVLPVLLHGDAAFAGQGVVAETFNMSQLPGYKTGGTVHIVVNNNIGFTTSPQSGRSSTYATDIAKMVEAPILHVNGDDPEACVRAVKLAFAFRQEYRKDVVIDLVCYRRHGHQEVDDPSYTQPLMYQKIEEHRSVRKIYTGALVNRGELTLEEAEKSLDDFQKLMQGAFEETKGSAPEQMRARKPELTGVLTQIETGVDRERLEVVHRALTTFPDGFEPHPKLKRMLEKRRSLLDRDAIDWAHGEALAFGSLLLEGIPVRLSGQDSRRGTFSQRHSVLVDFSSGEEYMPLAHLADHQAEFRAYDSLLSEYAAMGFDYGYSVANQDVLVLWEAQFGDFMNGAQIVIDQYVVAGEDKWGQLSGLVLLLPHGYEGQGPEHSSARIERFLTLSAEDSIQVAQPTTPAQYFHLLRRQVKRTVRKPLVVFTPKSLLRHEDARSATAEIVSGHFRETLDDPLVSDRDEVERILLCTGKVAYALKDEREERGAKAAIVRVEQLYPFPGEQLEAIFDRYPNARRLCWVQEEPENMGAWSFMQARLERILPERLELVHAARFESASPATGSQKVHQQEQEDLMEAAFEA
ncbi:MAG TPA: multifunctional oxoglutarate decarboxylase/oxoglutarate dehydrogenase thiamine pyrophosphate-binding subunit/dihydrolipoyllysine-residue succinyltransferase subunit [Actinomycetota bacterium]|nr:multifunctional oxoglutarate decarboxylase/oxoglutarate dehydrogenase thiamine pyrophosphate-binding subunit/dihydrolipoyllysine-residue succinyltransferase subunit [Actinomycetota bacterium]